MTYNVLRITYETKSPLLAMNGVIRNTAYVIRQPEAA